MTAQWTSGDTVLDLNGSFLGAYFGHTENGDIIIYTWRTQIKDNEVKNVDLRNPHSVTKGERYK